MENKLPIDKEKLRRLMCEIFLKPMKSKRDLTMYTFSPETVIQVNQMMKEEAERYTNNNKAPIREKK